MAEALNLEEIRGQIDQLDQEITKLICRRMEITKQVAAFKKKNGLPVYHPEREKKVIEKVSGLSGEEYGEAIAQIYQCIMDESKKVQEKWLAEHK